MREGYEPIPEHAGCYRRALDAECLLAYFEPGGGGPGEPHVHQHDHLIVLLNGTLELNKNGVETVLTAPASSRIGGDVPHSMWNVGGTTLEMVIVNLTPAASSVMPEVGRVLEIRELALSFCDLYLDKEYHNLCADLIDRMAEMPADTFLSGRTEIWAGGVIHAIGSINGLFRKHAVPHVTQGELARFFGATQQSVSNRGKQIREMFSMFPEDSGFSDEMLSMAWDILAFMNKPDESVVRKELESLAASIELARSRGLAEARSARNRKRQFDQVYQFKLKLLETSPPIWRRILVPGDYSFWDLHIAIQDAMGWLDFHLHCFRMNRPDHPGMEEIGIPHGDGIHYGRDGMPKSALAGWEEKIGDWFTERNNCAIYEYDFGDGWEHEVLLEEVLPRELRKEYPVCVAGSKSCPPEGCGGVHLYYELLKALRSPSHEDHESAKKWVGPYFDPDEFSPEEVSFGNPYERLVRTLELF